MLFESGLTRSALSWPDWAGRACLIVAGGPSAAGLPYARWRGRCAVLAINRAHELVPWADALYACDKAFWSSDAHAREFPGVKISGTAAPGVDLQATIVRERGQWSERMHFETQGHVGGGYNSGFQALNLALQFGATRVALAGYDATLEHGAHWHAHHEAPCTNPNPRLAAVWRRVLDDAAPATSARARVVNLSAKSALTAFPKQTLEQWASENL